LHGLRHTFLNKLFTSSMHEILDMITLDAPELMVDGAKPLIMKTVATRSRSAPRTRRAADLTGDRSGAAAVEFGLIAPILLVMLMAIIQFGLTLNNYLELTDAVRVAARNFAISGTATTPMSSSTTAADNSAANLTASSLTLTYSVNGAACSTDATCATALAADAGDTASVTGTYPCSLSVMGVNFAPSCTLSSSTTDMVE
jgi:Flp pilus assembly protein TadG